MARQGAVTPGTRTDIARTGMGVGVREGAPKPDISTPEAFKQTLLAAKSIVYVDPAQGATSGIHFASVLQRLGIAEAVKAKTKLVPGGYPAELVAKGEAELVAHQISEILPVKGRSEEHTSELQSRQYLVCRLLLEKKNKTKLSPNHYYMSAEHT